MTLAALVPDEAWEAPTAPLYERTSAREVAGRHGGSRRRGGPGPSSQHGRDTPQWSAGTRWNAVDDPDPRSDRDTRPQPDVPHGPSFRTGHDSHPRSAGTRWVADHGRSLRHDPGNRHHSAVPRSSEHHGPSFQPGHESRPRSGANHSHPDHDRNPQTDRGTRRLRGGSLTIVHHDPRRAQTIVGPHHGLPARRAYPWTVDPNGDGSKIRTHCSGARHRHSHWAGSYWADRSYSWGRMTWGPDRDLRHDHSGPRRGQCARTSICPAPARRCSRHHYGNHRQPWRRTSSRRASRNRPDLRSRLPETRRQLPTLG